MTTPRIVPETPHGEVPLAAASGDTRAHKRSARVLLALLTGSLLACPSVTGIVGPTPQTSDYYYTFSLALDDAAANQYTATTFDQVAPDRDFTVQVEARPVGSHSLICLHQAQLCDDTIAVFLQLTCTGVDRTYEMPLAKSGANAAGMYNGRSAMQACIGSTGQRSPASWRIILRRYTNNAVEFHVTVTRVDYNQ